MSHQDDHYRVRELRSMWGIGMFRRLNNSLFMHWRYRQSKHHYKTTTDFFTSMHTGHHHQAFRCIHARHPGSRTTS